MNVYFQPLKNTSSLLSQTSMIDECAMHALIQQSQKLIFCSTVVF